MVVCPILTPGKIKLDCGTGLSPIMFAEAVSVLIVSDLFTCVVSAAVDAVFCLQDIIVIASVNATRYFETFMIVTICLVCS
jgi:hypothetical protein